MRHHPQYRGFAPLFRDNPSPFRRDVRDVTEENPSHALEIVRAIYVRGVGNCSGTSRTSRQTVSRQPERRAPPWCSSLTANEALVHCSAVPLALPVPASIAAFSAIPTAEVMRNGAANLVRNAS